MSETDSADDDFEEYIDGYDTIVNGIIRKPTSVISEQTGGYSFDPLSESISSGTVGGLDVNVRTSRIRDDDTADIVVRFGGEDEPDVHFDTNDLVRAAILVLSSNGYEQFAEYEDA